MLRSLDFGQERFLFVREFNQIPLGRLIDLDSILHLSGDCQTLVFFFMDHYFSLFIFDGTQVLDFGSLRNNGLVFVWNDLDRIGLFLDFNDFSLFPTLDSDAFLLVINHQLGGPRGQVGGQGVALYFDDLLLSGRSELILLFPESDILGIGKFRNDLFDFLLLVSDFFDLLDQKLRVFGRLHQDGVVLNHLLGKGIEELALILAVDQESDFQEGIICNFGQQVLVLQIVGLKKRGVEVEGVDVSLLDVLESFEGLVPHFVDEVLLREQVDSDFIQNEALLGLGHVAVEDSLVFFLFEDFEELLSVGLALEYLVEGVEVFGVNHGVLVEDFEHFLRFHHLQLGRLLDFLLLLLGNLLQTHLEFIFGPLHHHLLVHVQSLFLLSRQDFLHFIFCAELGEVMMGIPVPIEVFKVHVSSVDQRDVGGLVFHMMSDERLEVACPHVLLDVASGSSRGLSPSGDDVFELVQVSVLDP